MIQLSARKAGVNVPDDVAILSFNNDSISELFDITTIALPLDSIGKMAVELFEKPEIIRHVKIGFTLVERKTV